MNVTDELIEKCTHAAMEVSCAPRVWENGTNWCDEHDCGISSLEDCCEHVWEIVESALNELSDSENATSVVTTHTREAGAKLRQPGKPQILKRRNHDS